MNFSAKNPVWDVQKAAPTKRSMNDDGVVIEQKIPQNPNHRIMLNPSGATVFLVLSNGPAIRGSNQYGVQLLREKISKGWLPWNECPVARGYIKGDGKACPGKDGRGNLDGPCVHLLRAQEKRAEAHKEREREFDERMQTNDALTAQYMKMKIKQDMAQEPAKKPMLQGKKK
tara:strand:+ start:105 stop:620 length:516 start_codon:yes stop_codon:yes gene_type:complete